jgi:hypothetical protein
MLADVQQDLSAAAYLAAQMGGFQHQSFGARLSAVATSFYQYVEKASKPAMNMVDAAISEIVAGARATIAAASSTQMPA